MDNKRYIFVHMPDKVCETLERKETQDFLMKWSMKGNLKVHFYSFNQPFEIHRKEDFVKSFFTDDGILSTLMYNQTPFGKAASSISLEHVPCTIQSMKFFDCILDPENGIIRSDGKTIVQCQEDDVAGFLIDDNLRNVILNENSKYYNIFSQSDRKQFLWKIFGHLCLGGEWCQHEFTVEPYLNMAKQVYKELVSVERIMNTSELVVRSIVLKVEAYDDNNKPLVPIKPENVQNFVYLIIDPFKRSIAVLSHCYGHTFCI